MLSLQPNISFVSEPCRGEHENKKRLVGETEDEVKWGEFVRNTCDLCSYSGSFRTTSDGWAWQEASGGSGSVVNPVAIAFISIYSKK